MASAHHSPQTEDGTQSERRRALFGRPDAGWCFLLAGLALGVSAALIPAYDAAARAQDVRDKALAVERRRLDRLDRYERYLEALESGDPRLVHTLAATQLGLVPESTETIDDAAAILRGGATILSELEPPPPAFDERPRPNSALRRLATDDSTRLWLLAAAGLLTIIGLLPRSEGTRADADDTDPDELGPDEYEDWD